MPLLARDLGASGVYSLIVASAFVVDGGIYRHEFVGHTVVQSILDVQLQTGKPFLSVVLTPQAFNEDLEVYEEMYVKHMVEKGRQAAEACSRMLEVPAEIQGLKKAA